MFWAAENITAKNCKRLSGMPMTSTGAERLFLLGARTTSALGQSATTRVRKSSSATPTALRSGCASMQTARRSGSCCAKGAAGPPVFHAGTAHSSGLGAAGDSQGQACQEARKARSEGHRARAHRRAAA
eukprot:972098-Pleurochrysis_carterae.AAC.1